MSGQLWQAAAVCPSPHASCLLSGGCETTGASSLGQPFPTEMLAICSPHVHLSLPPSSPPVSSRATTIWHFQLLNNSSPFY